MLRLDAARAAIRRDMADVLTSLHASSPDQWDVATRCAGWNVADLVAHLVWGQRLEASGLAGAASGRTEVELPEPVPATPGAGLIAQLEEAHGRLLAELDQLTDDDLGRLAPMPFGLAPVGLVLQIVTMEVGVHADDVRHALGAPGELGRDVVEASAVVLEAFLPTLAGAAAAPAEPVAFRFLGEGLDLTLAHDGAAWSTVPTTADVRFTGAGHDLVLYLLGRGDVDERRLEVAGDVTRATAFRSFVPGL